METNVQNLNFFVGSRPYMEIATKNDGVSLLGFHMAYGYEKEKNLSSLVVSFAAYGVDKFIHFTSRGQSAYALFNAQNEQVGVTQTGRRLNRFTIPLFKGRVEPAFVAEFAEKYGTFAKLGKWLDQQVEAEGFTSLIFNYTDFFRGFFPASAPPEQVEDALVLPDFKEQDDIHALGKVDSDKVVKGTVASVKDILSEDDDEPLQFADEDHEDYSL